MTTKAIHQNIPVTNEDVSSDAEPTNNKPSKLTKIPKITIMITVLRLLRLISSNNTLHPFFLQI